MLLCRYWAYSKLKATQPLTHCGSDEAAEMAVLMFNSLLVWAGLTRDGGFETEVRRNHHKNGTVS